MSGARIRCKTRTTSGQELEPSLRSARGLGARAKPGLKSGPGHGPESLPRQTPGPRQISSLKPATGYETEQF